MNASREAMPDADLGLNGAAFDADEARGKEPASDRRNRPDLALIFG